MNEPTARTIVEALLPSYHRVAGLVSDVVSDASYPPMADITTGFFMPLFHRFPQLQPPDFAGPFTPAPALSAHQCLEIQQALLELATCLSAVEAQLNATGTVDDQETFLPPLRDLSETVALGQRFIERALGHLQNPPKWWPR